MLSSHFPARSKVSWYMVMVQPSLEPRFPACHCGLTPEMGGAHNPKAPQLESCLTLPSDPRPQPELWSLTPDPDPSSSLLSLKGKLWVKRDLGRQTGRVQTHWVTKLQRRALWGLGCSHSALWGGTVPETPPLQAWDSAPQVCVPCVDTRGAPGGLRKVGPPNVTGQRVTAAAP